MRPSLATLFPDGDGIFQQDNDPKHTCNIVKNYLNNQNILQFTELPFGEDGYFRWPAQSPDLNPIENLWSIIDQRIKNRRPAGKEELFQIVQEAWNNLDMALLTKLVDSMPDRCAAVLANNGYPTKY